jgi:high-affinity nickel-transport protein
MLTLLSRTLRQPAVVERWITGICGLLILVNLSVWAWAVLVFRDQPVLAHGFGLRHAVDVDHIAAIDNATCKLMQAGKRPVGVGLFFTLGQSSVVILAVSGVAGAVTGRSAAPPPSASLRCSCSRSPLPT